jgi:hypothetical protein
VALQPGRQVPVAEQLLVGPDDRRDALADGGRQLLGGPSPRAGLVHVGRDAEAGAGLAGPAVRVLPGVAEPEDQGAVVVGLELPEDVAGPEPAPDSEHHGLGQGLAGVGGEQAPVGQHPGDGVGVGVDPAQQPVPGGREGVEDVAAGGGVALAGRAMRARMRSLRCLCAVTGAPVAAERPGPTPPCHPAGRWSPTSARRRSRGQPSPSPPRGRVAWGPGQGVGRGDPPVRTLPSGPDESSRRAWATSARIWAASSSGPSNTAWPRRRWAKATATRWP